MKLGFAIPTFSGIISVPLAAAGRAAAAGADGVFAVDHLFPPGRPERPSFEPFSLLAAAAAAHPGLGVGALVARAGMRPPAMLAKQAASLHEMSGGRAILGLGMGDALVRAEHTSLGLAFLPAEDRVDTVRATAVALRRLFAGRAWSGDGRLPALEGPLLPAGGPPVWLGGVSDRMVRAAARYGDAWNGWGLDVEGFRDRVGLLGREVREGGRDPADVPPTWGGIVLVGRDRAELEGLESDRAARGVAWDPWRGTVDDLRRFAADLERAGAAWMVCLPAGPDDRTELIARTLGEA